jgi:hypothetical protein
MTKNYVRQFFLKVAKEQIYKEVNSQKVLSNLADLKEVVKATKFPIIFVFLGTLKTILRFTGGFSLNPYFQAIKFSTYYYWLTQSWRINTLNFKLQKRVRLYREL